MRSLAEFLADAQRGCLPVADGGVTVVPQPSARDLGVLAFTAHSVVFADVEPEWVRERLPAGDLSAPLSPPFLQDLGVRTRRHVGTIDLLVLAAPVADPARVPLREVTGDGHPRVERALRHRDAVRVWAAEGGVVTVGRGVAGRWEVAVEVEPGHRGRGLGRLLAEAARHLCPGPIWAQIAPGNAASVRAFLAAGYVPMGAEVLLTEQEAT
ncbi:GNAT family N-acetyltransferase [Nonomuraea aridisoli]|uniref:GNAT family N-acetyltransferase n=1 Tax=Nonomuraea aridisoli TaxID=2070368 RepID=A0A2W2E421_9ACTN|nr:GNAT family N-acetyltransferase [Nonomuraea aridisoli]PZG17373.1 GNAT family N-acetyltransferase [Nonomuraea aridisoli]